MNKENFSIFKKLACVLLSACAVGSNVGMIPTHASTGDDMDGSKIRPRLSCLPLVRLDALMDDLTSEVSQRMIDRIFLSPTDRDLIIEKATRSAAHKNLLRIGFAVCIAWDRTPESDRTPLREWEMDSVCRLIRIFWNSSTLTAPPSQRYRNNVNVRFFHTQFLDTDDHLDLGVARAYFNQAIFRLRYFDESSCFSLENASKKKQKRAVAFMDSIVGPSTAFDSCLLVACFDKGGCHYLADCIWSIMSEYVGFKAGGFPASFGNHEKASVNDTNVWLREITCSASPFDYCVDFLKSCDEEFTGVHSFPNVVCSREYIEKLEARAVLKRAEDYRLEEKKKADEVKKKEMAEAMERKKEARLEKSRQQQEKRKQRKAEEEERLRIEEEARRQAEEDAKREAAEKAKRQAEEEAKREAEEEAKREAEIKRKKEEEERIRAEHIRSGVAEVIAANRYIFEAHENEPNHDDGGRKFPPPTPRATTSPNAV